MRAIPRALLPASPRDMLAVFDENNAVFATEVDLNAILRCTRNKRRNSKTCKAISVKKIKPSTEGLRGVPLRASDQFF